MLSNDQMAAEMAAVRDQMLAAIVRHEKEAHGGMPCWPNRASALAFFAHTLGIDGTAMWHLARDYAEDYKTYCTQPDCWHRKDRSNPATPKE